VEETVETVKGEIALVEKLPKIAEP
jgi:hypothetical protein